MLRIIASGPELGFSRDSHQKVKMKTISMRIRPKSGREAGCQTRKFDCVTQRGTCTMFNDVRAGNFGGSTLGVAPRCDGLFGGMPKKASQMSLLVMRQGYSCEVEWHTYKTRAIWILSVTFCVEQAGPKPCSTRSRCKEMHRDGYQIGP